MAVVLPYPKFVSPSGKADKPFQVVIGRKRKNPIHGGRFRTIEEAVTKRNQILYRLDALA